ncbi:MAG: alpha-galactosidase [Lentisphaeria bacterium]|nr:alpha-galactosidase [Lentisphaeria bacterium]
MKLSIIGAGSLGFTRRLVYDLLAVPEFRSAEVSLHDIDERNLDMIFRVLKRDIDAAGFAVKLTADPDRRLSLTRANYIVCCARVGGLEAFEQDVEIPLSYGVDQCVGDTLGPGGLMYAQRTIPVLLEICRDIREVASPGALLLNYANPNAMNTWACNLYGGVPTVGLCHGVQNGAKLIAKALGVPVEKLDYVCAGINHQTWYIRLRVDGREITSEELLAAMRADPEIAEHEKIRLDMLERFGYFTTESNGHSSEYVPWYRKRPGEIAEWISMDSWIHGETAGYLRVCRENRDYFEYEYPRILSEPPHDFSTPRSIEHCSYIIEGLETGRAYRGCFNVINRNYITNLPEGCVVELPAVADRKGIRPETVGRLPLACAATCSASVRVQEMGMEAAVRGDVLLLKQAMLHDPLTGAVLNPPEIWQMADEMLLAQRKWLPQYADVMGAVRGRLKKRIVSRALRSPGLRRDVKSVAEIEASRRREAASRQASGRKLDYDPDREVSVGCRG